MPGQSPGTSDAARLTARDCDHCTHRDRLIDCGARLKTDAAAVIDAMAAELESSAGQHEPNDVARLKLLNEIINLASFYLNGHQRDIVTALMYEAAQGHTCDDPETITHSRELLQITRETPRNGLPGKIYRAAVLALVPVICPELKKEFEEEEN